METPWRRFTPEGGLVKIWLQGSEEMTFHICKGEIVQKDVQLTLKKQFEEKMGGKWTLLVVFSFPLVFNFWAPDYTCA